MRFSHTVISDQAPSWSYEKDSNPNAFDPTSCMPQCTNELQHDSWWGGYFDPITQYLSMRIFIFKLLITLYIFTLYPGWRKSVLALYGFFSFLLFFFILLFQLEIGILYFTPLHSYFFFFSSPHQFLFKYFCFICIRDLYIRYFRGSSSSKPEKPEKPEKFTIRTSDKCHENNLIFFSA